MQDLPQDPATAFAPTAVTLLVDAGANTAGLSNVPNARARDDTVAPAAVTDLAASLRLAPTDRAPRTNRRAASSSSRARSAA